MPYQAKANSGPIVNMTLVSEICPDRAKLVGILAAQLAGEEGQQAEPLTIAVLLYVYNSAENLMLTTILCHNIYIYNANVMIEYLEHESWYIVKAWMVGTVRAHKLKIKREHIPVQARLSK